MSAELRLFKLLQLSSPSLPIGTYAYSQGLEFAIDQGWVSGVEDLSEWLEGLLDNNLANLDLPVLERRYLAWKNFNLADAKHWNQVLMATRESYELQLEDEQLGIGLKRVLGSWGLKDDVKRMYMLKAATYEREPLVWSYVSIFALAGVLLDIDYLTLAHSYLWSWLENQVSVATKTIPIGQTDGLCVIERVVATLPKVMSKAATVEDENIGVLAPMFALGSCLHESQYSRLFRS